MPRARAAITTPGTTDSSSLHCAHRPVRRPFSDRLKQISRIRTTTEGPTRGGQVSAGLLRDGRRLEWAVFSNDAQDSLLAGKSFGHPPSGRSGRANGRQTYRKSGNVHTLHHRLIDHREALARRRGIPQQNARTRQSAEQIECFVRILGAVNYISLVLQQRPHSVAKFGGVLNNKQNGDRHATNPKASLPEGKPGRRSVARQSRDTCATGAGPSTDLNGRLASRRTKCAIGTWLAWRCRRSMKTVTSPRAALPSRWPPDTRPSG
jgi:hypothetical protein